MARHVFDLTFKYGHGRWVRVVDEYLKPDHRAPLTGGPGWDWLDHEIVDHMRFEVAPGVIAVTRAPVVVRLDGTLVVPLQTEDDVPGILKTLEDNGWVHVDGRLATFVAEMDGPVP